MRRTRVFQILVLSVTAAFWMGAGTASATDCTVVLTDGTSVTGRTTDGKVRSIKKDKLILTKHGDMLELVPHDHVVVSGKKDTYSKIKKNDYLDVCFHRTMTRKEPRWVYGIEVVEPPDEHAEDVE